MLDQISYSEIAKWANLREISNFSLFEGLNWGVELMIIILAFLRLRLTDKIYPLLRLTPNFFDRLTAKGYLPWDLVCNVYRVKNLN